MTTTTTTAEVMETALSDNDVDSRVFMEREKDTVLLLVSLFQRSTATAVDLISPICRMNFCRWIYVWMEKVSATELIVEFNLAQVQTVANLAPNWRYSLRQRTAQMLRKLQATAQFKGAISWSSACE